MKLKITTRATDNLWGPVLMKLQRAERSITAGERHIAAGERTAMEARWEFGRELLHFRKERKGRQEVPADLMKLAMEKCGCSRREISYRIKFAEKFPTKTLAGNALQANPSWRKMISNALVDKKRMIKKEPANHSGKWLARRLSKDLDRALTYHADISRDEVKDWETLRKKIDIFLAQIDRNDDAKAEAVS